MDVSESPLILYLVIWYVFTTNNLLRFRLWDSSVTRLKYRFFSVVANIYPANKFYHIGILLQMVNDLNQMFLFRQYTISG